MHRRKYFGIIIIFCLFFILIAGHAAAVIPEERPEAFSKIIDLPIRVIGLGLTVAGSAVFIVALPFTLTSGTTGDAWDALVIEPYEFTFTRPLGIFDDWRSFTDSSKAEDKTELPALEEPEKDIKTNSQDCQECKSMQSEDEMELQAEEEPQKDNETETHSFRLRLLYGSFSVEKVKATNNSIALIWNGWGLGHTNDNYLDKKSGETLEFQTQFTDLSYTFDLSELIIDSLTMTLGAGIPSGEGIITSSTNTAYKSSTVSGYSFFTVFGIELSYFEILAGFRLNNIKYSEFESSSANTLDGDYTVFGGQPVVGLGLSF